MQAVRFVSRLAAYAWASPNTALGLVAGALALCLGSRIQLVSGVAEFSGGLPGRLLDRFPGPCRFGAITLGHVILGISQAELSALRPHEHVHVHQYERWGPFFLPAYALSSAWQAVRGGCGYRENFFERQAYASEACPGPQPETCCSPCEPPKTRQTGMNRSSRRNTG